MTTTKEKVPNTEKKAAMSDYKSHLGEAMQVKEMTDTKQWKEIYRHIKNSIECHKTSLEDAEKPRDVALHQAGIKVLRCLIDEVRQPIVELDNYIMGSPLFCQDMKTRAKWNEPLGIVEITEV